MAFHAYLFFSDGKCKEAITRYQEIFGGDLEVMTFADLPPGADSMPGAKPEQVMHSALKVGDGLLMASDDPSGDGGPVKGVAIHHSAADVADGERIFDRLADGGDVAMPFGEVFWAQRFGMCTDRFGTQWMISVDHPAPTG